MDRDPAGEPPLVVAPPPTFALAPNEAGNTVFALDNPLQPRPDDTVDWQKYADLSFFVGLVAIGFVLTREEAEKNVMHFVGGIMFNAGFAPFVLSLWALLTGSSMFRRENTLRVMVAGVLFLVGYTLINIQGSLVDSLFRFLSANSFLDQTGPALFEIGALFFISKFFFLGEDDEMKIERLEKELEEARRSPGMGLALSYFYNFVLPTASNIRDTEPTLIDVENLKREKFPGIQLRTPRLFIFVPRILDARSDIKTLLRTAQEAGLIWQGKPQEPPTGGTHRPLFAYLLHCDLASKVCDLLFDIPTVISSCLNRAEHVQEQQQQMLRNLQQRGVANSAAAIHSLRDPFQELAQDLLVFQNHLLELVQQHDKVRDKVRVLSLPLPGLRLNGLQQLSDLMPRIVSVAGGARASQSS